MMNAELLTKKRQATQSSWHAWDWAAATLQGCPSVRLLPPSSDPRTVYERKHVWMAYTTRGAVGGPRPGPEEEEKPSSSDSWLEEEAV